MKTKLTIIATFMSLSLSAQTLSQTGTSVKELVPEGWTVQEAWGDLYQNGRDDLVLIATPNDSTKMKARDDGYVYDFNQPILAVYYMSEEGDLILHEQHDDIIPVRDEYVSYDVSAEVKRGNLVITVIPFASAGSYYSSVYEYVFRHQNDAFYLIGLDIESFARNTGDGERISINYLTHKQWTLPINAFDNSKDNEKPKWSSVPKEPLKRLGTFILE